MRRMLAVTAVVALAMPACGDDGKPDRTIAFLRSTVVNAASQDAFLGELEAAGWTLGENLTVLSPDPSEHHPERADGERTVEGWVDDDDVDLVIALSTTAALAAMTVTDEVPVLTLANDPVGSGLVDDPRHPGGNVSGIAFRVPPDRTLDVARQLDGTAPIGLLAPSTDPAAEPVRQSFLAAGDALSVDIVDAQFDGPEGVDDAVAVLDTAGARVAVLVNAPATVEAYAELGDSLDAAGIASVANTITNDFAVAVLAPESLAVYRQLGRQAVRVLGGTDIGDIPLEDPGEYDLVVREEIAADLGLTVPEDLRAQASELSD